MRQFLFPGSAADAAGESHRTVVDHGAGNARPWLSAAALAALLAGHAHASGKCGRQVRIVVTRRRIALVDVSLLGRRSACARPLRLMLCKYSLVNERTGKLVGYRPLYLSGLFT